MAVKIVDEQWCKPGLIVDLRKYTSAMELVLNGRTEPPNVHKPQLSGEKGEGRAEADQSLMNLLAALVSDAFPSTDSRDPALVDRVARAGRGLSMESTPGSHMVRRFIYGTDSRSADTVHLPPSSVSFFLFPPSQITPRPWPVQVAQRYADCIILTTVT